MNFLDFFELAVQAHEAKGYHKSMRDTKDKAPYNLYEDLKIILQLSKSGNATFAFKELSEGDLSHRSIQSVRGRHKDFIKNLVPTDIYTIIDYIKAKKSIKGFLIQSKDALGNSIFSVRENFKHAGKPSLQVDNSSAKALVPADANLTSKQQKKRLFEKLGESEGAKQQVEQLHPTEKPRKQLKVAASNQVEQVEDPASILQKKQKLSDARELDFYMTFLANYDNVQKKSLIHVLDQLSGDFNQLVDYLQTRNQNLLWKEDEDQVLRTFDQQTPQSIYLLKTLKKGKHNILRRAEYLSITLPDFE